MDEQETATVQTEELSGMHYLVHGMVQSSYAAIAQSGVDRLPLHVLLEKMTLDGIIFGVVAAMHDPEYMRKLVSEERGTDEDFDEGVQAAGAVLDSLKNPPTEG